MILPNEAWSLKPARASAASASRTPSLALRKLRSLLRMSGEVGKFRRAAIARLCTAGFCAGDPRTTPTLCSGGCERPSLPLWTGREAVALGLADGLGDAESEAKRRFGEDVTIIPVGRRRRPFPWRMLPSVEGAAASLSHALEERAAWARLGL